MMHNARLSAREYKVSFACRAQARMCVPKLVCEIPYASGFAWFESVDRGNCPSVSHNSRKQVKVKLRI
jgi:hypothetical protein